MTDAPQTLDAAAALSQAWPFEEARKLVARLEKTGKTEALFETGYGPSGLPHIGTFGEVARTSMVRKAFEVLTGGKVKTRLLVFSDDMDGMRKIPENVPDPAALEPFLQRPLTAVPNPFGGDHPSFGHHNNAMLRRFLDTFGFDYEFASATDYYREGRFDAVLMRAAERYGDIMKVMLPTLGAERQATYSPFLPISPTTGRVLYVPMKEVNAKDGTVTFTDEDGRDATLPVTGGRVKLQWKPDFGMRWAALDVDFEMFGKDHQTNAGVYDRICAILGGLPPEHYVYELFLDEQGQKISKSKGNGLTIDEWLTYASPESLALYMFHKPREAKKLHFDVIPKAMDDYLQFIDAYPRQDWKNRLGNPVWHIHGGAPPAPEAMPADAGSNAPRASVSFALLLNLVAVANAEDKDVLWGFIRRYAPGTDPTTHPHLDRMAGYAIRYFKDFVKPAKSYRLPTDTEREALEDLASKLGELARDGVTDPALIQDAVLDVGRRDPWRTPGKDGGWNVGGSWFQMLYQVLLGEERGPRFGSFVAIYGAANTKALVEKALSGELLREHDAFKAGREAA
jgi:lysyl-tRNA synthetase, class I